MHQLSKWVPVDGTLKTPIAVPMIYEEDAFFLQILHDAETSALPGCFDTPLVQGSWFNL